MFGELFGPYQWAKFFLEFESNTISTKKILFVYILLRERKK